MEKQGQSNEKLNKILAVDDEEMFLVQIKLVLSPFSYQIITTTKPKQAMELIDTSFDLIMLDLMMPEISGIFLVNEIRNIKKYSNIPIIILTAKERSNEEIASLFELGVNDFISKPFLEEELISRIKIQIKVKKLVEELSETNEQLKHELERNKKTNFITMQYASLIEQDLLEKIDKLSVKADSRGLKSSITKLKSQLAFIQDEQSKLILENSRYKSDLDRLNKIHSVVVLHDQAIEEDMTIKINEVSQKANVDFLTQIYNRFKFYEFLYLEIERAKTENNDLSIIMFDIDHFKQINDTYGHDAGDQVLVALSAIVTNILTGKEIFARWGGEEFMVLLPDKNMDDSKDIAETIRNGIEKTKINMIDRVTCSFGVTQFERQDDAAAFLKKADNALYCAKNNGRNRVEVLSSLNQILCLK